MRSTREIVSPAIWHMAAALPFIAAMFFLLEADFLSRLPRDASLQVAKHQERMFGVGCAFAIMAVCIVILQICASLDERNRKRKADSS